MGQRLDVANVEKNRSSLCGMWSFPAIPSVTKASSRVSQRVLRQLDGEGGHHGRDGAGGGGHLDDVVGQCQHGNRCGFERVSGCSLRPI